MGPDEHFSLSLDKHRRSPGGVATAAEIFNSIQIERAQAPALSALKYEAAGAPEPQCLVARSRGRGRTKCSDVRGCSTYREAKRLFTRQRRLAIPLIF